jgi:hypothetical protein
MHWMGDKVHDDMAVQMVLSLGQVILIFVILLFAAFGCGLIFCAELCLSCLQENTVLGNCVSLIFINTNQKNDPVAKPVQVAI